MTYQRRIAILLVLAPGISILMGADWSQFRGPHGLGTSPEKGLPVHWPAKKNIVWKTRLPGPGTSSPVTVGNRIFLTCYTGYAQGDGNPGKMEDLKRHVVC